MTINIHISNLYFRCVVNKVTIKLFNCSFIHNFARRNILSAVSNCSYQEICFPIILRDFIFNRCAATGV